MVAPMPPPHDVGPGPVATAPAPNHVVIGHPGNRSAVDHSRTALCHWAGRLAALDPGRPFTADEADPRPPVHRTAPTLVEVEPTVVELAIDRALAWSTRHLAATVRLAALVPYLDAGGSGHVVAARLALAADDLAAGAAQLDAIVVELRAASGAGR